jgi:hypothetical protein
VIGESWRRPNGASRAVSTRAPGRLPGVSAISSSRMPRTMPPLASVAGLPGASIPLLESEIPSVVTNSFAVLALRRLDIVFASTRRQMMRTAVRRLPSAGVFLRRRLGVEQLPARLAPRLSVIMIMPAFRAMREPGRRPDWNRPMPRRRHVAWLSGAPSSVYGSRAPRCRFSEWLGPGPSR